jgi:hypothetical protein
VRTLPVVFGRDRALALSLVPLAAGALASATAGGVGGAVAVTSLAVQGALSVRARTRAYSRPALAVAIEFAPLWLLTAILALTA